MGDRSHWRSDEPDLLILEGWFLGVKPLSKDITDNPTFKPSLSSKEFLFRATIQENLIEYLNIWSLIDYTWHLKPIKFEYMNLWKFNQEKDMLFKKGNALQDIKLSNFLRMLNVSIPHKCFDDIKSDVLLLINQDRKLIEVGLNP